LRYLSLKYDYDSFLGFLKIIYKIIDKIIILKIVNSIILLPLYIDYLLNL